MRFAKVFEMFRKKGLQPRKGIDLETKEVKKERVPRHIRTGEKITSEQWDFLLNLDRFDYFERRKLELMRKYYPTPVTSNMFRADLGGKGSYVPETFRSINDKLYRNYDNPLPYKIEGEGEGFQLFIVAPIH